MANWTDQTQQVFTRQDFDSKWGSHGKHYCKLCNRDFQIGDKWRWIYATSLLYPYPNFSVCEECDGPDVLTRYVAACELLYKSLKGRGEGHWPVDIAAQLIAARERIVALESALEAAHYDHLEQMERDYES
jgi:hypothetical protein